TGTVIGGSPGISTTVEPITGSCGGAPGGGGGGGGGMPLLVLIMITAPGTVWPLGVVPTTVPGDAVLLTGVGWSATPNPASLSRCLAVSTLSPDTLGTLDPGPPSTYRGSVGGSFTSPKPLAIGFIASNQVRAGSFPPYRFPGPHCRSLYEHKSVGVVESSKT